jgi:hypothetical protein
VITVIDLTHRGSKDLRAAAGTAGSSSMPSVLRPRGLPALAHGAADLVPVGYWDDGKTTPPSAQLNDVVLILADLDPAVGADHLTAWTDRIMVAVTAGRSSVEKARTVGDQVRAAGLDLRFAALLRTERSDDSSGMISRGRPAPVQRRTEQEDPEPAGRFEAR